MSPDNEHVNSELDTLIGALVNGIATPDETKHLEHLLRADAAAREHYRRYMNLHVALLGLSGVAMNSAYAPLDRDPALTTLPSARAWSAGKARKRWGIIVFATAAAAVLVLALLGTHVRPDVLLSKPASLARITRSSGARWIDDAQSIAVDSRLTQGLFELSSGLIELTMDNDATVLLQAPVSFELKTSRRVALRNGHIVVRADKTKGDFIVETVHATVTDLGTEFGVGVGPAGDTQVQVFQGIVVADWKAQDGKSVGSKQITAGQAISIESNVGVNAHDIPFTEDRFIRTFPEDDRVNPALAVFNKTALETIQVVAAPLSLSIDGNLADWNLSGQFQSKCVAPYDTTYFVDGAMMHDAEYLYIGAHVGDPFPMRNSRDVAAAPDLIWEGGSVVVRLSTDAALGWPLEGHSGYVGDYRGDPLNGRRPQDTSEKIVHLIIWYDKRAEQPRLALEFGMDYHGRINFPKGWKGVFKKDDNEHGYTLEYAIPWKLLNAKSAPRVGDVLATSWLVHWSDKQGVRPRGYLVEFKNPSEKRVDILWGKTFGKAIFRANTN